MDPWTDNHLKWLVDTGERLHTADGKEVEIWEFLHEEDETMFDAWAKHFRNHYCLDTDIDFMRGSKSRSSYLKDIKFPSLKSKLGPSVRAGDFGEILVADYLQWARDCWVPRVRWGSKMVRDESPKGSDVIGFRFHKAKGTSRKDLLTVVETKTKFSKSSKNRVQDAINDSAKDHIRIDESLNFIKQKLFERENFDQAKRVERFQSPADSPYDEVYGAVAVICDDYFSADEITSADSNKTRRSTNSKNTTPHPNRDKLFVLVIKGADMMHLVHELYRRAADEA